MEMAASTLSPTQEGKAKLSNMAGLGLGSESTPQSAATHTEVSPPR